MSSKRDKILLGVAATVGTGIVTWRTFFPWIGYDLATLRKLAKIGILAKRDVKNGRFLIDMFEEVVQKNPKKPFIIFEDNIYTYEFMNDQANRVANIAMKWGLKLGECVAIVMENEPSFIWTFLGLQKLGIAVSLVNFHINGQPLVHSIRACEAKVLIVGSDEKVVQSVEEIRHEIGDIPVYVQGHASCPNYESWDSLMISALPVPVCPNVRHGVGPNTTCGYIFTSGTTGLPKPAIIKQEKAILFSKSFQIFDLRPSDVLYICTPLYHTAGGGMGLMSTIDQGATMVLKRKFSANHYFEDVRKYNVTVIQYIGELCRYLLSVPESPLDGAHKVRVAVGNGLRTDIWEKFKQRYRIPRICEFYGATEGVTGYINISNRTGACGRYSPFLVWMPLFPACLSI